MAGFQFGKSKSVFNFKNHPDILPLNGSNVRSMVYHEYNIVLVHLALRPRVLQNGAIKCFFT